MSQNLRGLPTGEEEIGSHVKNKRLRRNIEFESRSLASCDDLPQFLLKTGYPTYCTRQVQEVYLCQKPESCSREMPRRNANGIAGYSRSPTW